MRLEFKPSFESSLKDLPPQDKEDVKKVIAQTIDILSQDRLVHQGIGLKRLRSDYWEVRKGLRCRLVFRWSGDLVEFIIVGDHRTIRRFLKSI
jgi:mRNA-degrading endonuclease RelE of RelBE toxin-antitoxin system